MPRRHFRAYRWEGATYDNMRWTMGASRNDSDRFLDLWFSTQSSAADVKMMTRNDVLALRRMCDEILEDWQ